MKCRAPISDIGPDNMKDRYIFHTFYLPRYRIGVRHHTDIGLDNVKTLLGIILNLLFFEFERHTPQQLKRYDMCASCNFVFIRNGSERYVQSRRRVVRED